MSPLVVTTPFRAPGLAPNIGEGWFLGGTFSGSTQSDKWTFATATMANETQTSMFSVSGTTALVNSSNIHISSATIGGSSTQLRKRTIATATWSLMSISLGTAIDSQPAGMNNETVGIFAAGATGGTTITAIQEVQFSPEVYTARGNVLTSRKFVMQGAFNNETEGFIVNGSNTGLGTYYQTTEKYTFGTSGVVLALANAANDDRISIAGAGTKTNGYLAGGGVSPNFGVSVNKIEKFEYATGTSLVGPTSGGLARHRQGVVCNQNRAVFSGGVFSSDGSSLSDQSFTRFFKFADDTWNGAAPIQSNRQAPVSGSTHHAGL